nr:RsmB/NOP family class I SAM-dependent RNA methyltransferase [Solobacterium sp.]
VPWCKEGFYYPADKRPGTLPQYYAGLYYIQEASAMIPAALLPVQEHEVVLDACCAPGGKSTALMCGMRNTGLLVSNDISASRQNATIKTMGRFGAANAVITACDLNDMERKFPKTFDKILLDAPCSGEGMFRRDPSLIREWEEKGSAYYQPIQKSLILSAWNMLKEGGMMVYSTCTFAPEENEDVILHLLSEHPEAEILPAPFACEGIAHGIREGCENCVRMYPHRIAGEGHFAALIRKPGHSESVLKKTHLSAKLPEDLKQFLTLIRKDIPAERILIRSDQAYLLPEYELPSAGLRILSSGLLLGTLKNNRFEPSQQLAQWLMKEDFRNTVSFSADDPNILRYLRGETIRTEQTMNGWVLVCIEKWPLGFARADGHTLKNRIGKGWRML